jgi:hypothetical protein
MGLKRSIDWISSGRFLYDEKLAITLWFGLSLIAVVQSNYNHGLNNYLIFKQVFWHTIHHQNLYAHYASEYFDVNLYGPLFSIVIAPFALLPDFLGSVLWVMFNAAILYFAIMKLPISNKFKMGILILSANEMMNNSGNLQSNALIAACIILGFVYTRKGREVWALFFILLATFIKIYGVVGFAFFFFSRNKWDYIKWLITWSLVFFLLPALISSFSYVLQCYHDWAESIMNKSDANTRVDFNNDQDISVMGMMHRIFNWWTLKDLWVLIPAGCLFLLQYLKFKYFKDIRFQLYLLCSVLLFTVIFSNSAESPTYVIAVCAICLWYMIQPSSKAMTVFFIFALVITSFSYSDIFTSYVRNFMGHYALKALPCFIIWLVIIYQVYTRQFLKIKLNLLDAK